MAGHRIDTKRAPRRTLAFTDVAALRTELDRIEASHRSGRLTTTGNWTPGEILDHLATLWEFSLDGFPAHARAPWAMRLVGPLLKPMFTRGKTAPAGIRLPEDAAYLLPAAGTPFDRGLARLRRVLDRVDRGERCERASPMFGRTSHPEWMRLHFGHCQLHLGFLRPD